MVINVEIKKDKKESKFCYFYKMTTEASVRRTLERIEFEHIPSFFLLNERKIYLSDQTTDSFEIKQILKSNNKIQLKSIGKYPTLKGVRRVFRLRKCVLIHMKSDDIYLTNP